MARCPHISSSSRSRRRRGLPALLVLLVLGRALLLEAFVGVPSQPHQRLQRPNSSHRAQSCDRRRALRQSWAAGADEQESTKAESAPPPAPVSASPPSPPQQQQEQDEEVTPWEYFFGKPGELEADLRSVGISRQRLLLNAGVATVLALGADFLGTTSALLGNLPPDKVDGLQLDVLYPIRGFKRFVNKDGGYEFRYPKTWVQDQAVLLAETRERTAAAASMSGIDPLSASRPIRIPGGRPRRPGQGVRPDAALGPPGGDADENVSVVKSRVAPGFSLEGSLGAPRQAAETLLATAIAAPGSGKNATLIDARAERRGAGGLVYEFEYVVRRDAGPRQFALHSLSVIAARPAEDTLFTLTVLAPESRWKEREAELRQVAQSFRLLR